MGKVPETVEYWLKKADEAIENAVILADERGMGFTWNGPGYGMGGTYRAAPVMPMTRQQALNILASGRPITADERTRMADALNSGGLVDEDDWDSSTESGWYSSSQSC